MPVKYTPQFHIDKYGIKVDDIEKRREKSWAKHARKDKDYCRKPIKKWKIK